MVRPLLSVERIWVTHLPEFLGIQFDERLQSLLADVALDDVAFSSVSKLILPVATPRAVT
ncbi:MAG: hypothetical protein H0T48_16580 [Gemmatimonadaceae bacterium]|nr:hypothetical protein [Gemmatimonadaceae bacterium]